MGEKRPAVVLLSGGLDSATTLAIARRDGFDPYALSFRYGQRHRAELEAAGGSPRASASPKHVVARHRPAAVRRLGPHGGSGRPEGPDGRRDGRGHPRDLRPGPEHGLPVVRPGLGRGARSTDIFIGVNALDYSGYPDCRPEFIEAFQRMANLATRMGVEGSRPLTIHTPLIHLTKAEIIRTGLELGRRLRIDADLLRPFPRRRGLRGL